MTNRSLPNPTRILRSLIATCAAVALLLPAAWAQSPAGTIKRVAGQPMLQSTSGTRPAEVGATLNVGDRIVTSEGSAAGITLHDGTQLSVGPNATVSMQQFQFNVTTHEGTLLVDVARGAMRMVSGLIARADARNVSVTTRTAIIGIRGTDVLIDAGDGLTSQ